MQLTQRDDQTWDEFINGLASCAHDYDHAITKVVETENSRVIEVINEDIDESHQYTLRFFETEIDGNHKAFIELSGAYGEDGKVYLSAIPAVVFAVIYA